MKELYSAMLATTVIFMARTIILSKDKYPNYYLMFCSLIFLLTLYFARDLTKAVKYMVAFYILRKIYRKISDKNKFSEDVDSLVFILTVFAVIRHLIKLRPND